MALLRPAISRLNAALFVALVVAGCVGTGAAVRAEAEPPLANGPQQSAPSCPSPPPAIRDIRAARFYTDPANSIADPDKVAQNRAWLAPVIQFGTRIQAMAADSYDTPSKAGAGDTPGCIRIWLAAWARADALLGRMEEQRQAEYERKWSVVALALPYLATRPPPAVRAHNPDYQQIDAWFGRLATAIRPPYEDSVQGRPRANPVRNNHLNWAAAAVMLAGLAAGEREHIAWAVEKYRLAIQQIGPDGSLPLEVKRAGRATHYHRFALMPLVLTAEIAARNGIDLYAESLPQLRLLVDRVLADYADPSLMAQMAGTPQQPPNRTRDGRLSGTDIAWMEAWRLRFPDPRLSPHLDAILTANRPAAAFNIGGNWSVYFSSDSGYFQPDPGPGR